MKQLTIYTDGGARGNPGPAGIGAVLVDEQGKVVKEISEYLGETTNNFAEYEALIHALTAARALSDLHTHVAVCMDSELAVRQLNGMYKVKEPTLKQQFAKVQGLRDSFSHITFTHVRRAQNAHADRLVNQAIDAALGKRRKAL